MLTTLNPLTRLRTRLALQSGTDVEGTIQRVAAGARLTPENLWLLACSAVLASIGLDVSSAAVVIGAMLISPLMGPIIGVGLSMGITDRRLLQSSLRELALATAFSIGVSAAYFVISPLATPTSELIARTRPTLLDVGVAMFGGIAGIVAGSRKQQSLALPGVAIATALMPPLCTAGFGLATGNWPFFFGAFYLFGLNAIFIALSTLLIVRILQFPRHEEVTLEARKRERRMVTAVAVLATLPSVYFLYDSVRAVREQNRIRSFVETEIEAPGRAAPQWERADDSNEDVLKVYIAGHPIEPEGIAQLQAALPRYGLDGIRLELMQSDISARDLERFQGEVQRELLRAVSTFTAARDSAAVKAEQEQGIRIESVARELASAFPEIQRIAYVSRLNLLAPDSVPSPPAFIVTFNNGIPAAARAGIVARSQALLRSRLGRSDFAVIER